MIKKGLFNKIIDKTKEHSPEILIGAGIASMVTSTVLAVRATPKALDLIENKKAELGTTYLTKKETVQVAWKPYIPSIITGGVGIACIIGGTTTNLKRQSALAAVYALSESTLKEYKTKVKEKLGDEGARKIEEEVNSKVGKARIKERPVIVDSDESPYVENTGCGQTLFYDSLSGRYFRSSMNAIDRAVNNLNKSLMQDYYMTVNDLYNEIGISTIGAGSLIGWSTEKEMCEVTYSTEINESGLPYVILGFRNVPQPLFV